MENRATFSAVIDARSHDWSLPRLSEAGMAEVIRAAYLRSNAAGWIDSGGGLVSSNDGRYRRADL